MNVKMKREKRGRRHKRVRAKIFGTAKVPRLCVFRSAKHIYAQLINDEGGKTLAAVSDAEVKIRAKTAKRKVKKSLVDKVSASKRIAEDKKEERTGKEAIAYEVGKLIAGKCLTKKIEKVVFDRGGCKYHGRVKALADGAREGGLKF